MKCCLAFQINPPSKLESINYMNWRWGSTDLKDRYITNITEKLKTCEDRLKWLNSFSIPNKNILDVGAGNGAFCYAGNKYGCNVIGTEISLQAIKRAKELFGVKLVYGDIDVVPNTPKFGVVTMWDVIEHLRDPLNMLTEIKNRMVNNGLIVIETGNYNSIDRFIMKERWGLYLFDHIYYFTTKSLESILNKAGFSNFKIHTMRMSKNKSSFYKNIINNFYNSKKLFTKLRKKIIVNKFKKDLPRNWDLNIIIATARVNPARVSRMLHNFNPKLR